MIITYAFRDVLHDSCVPEFKLNIEMNRSFRGILRVTSKIESFSLLLVAVVIFRQGSTNRQNTRSSARRQWRKAEVCRPSEQHTVRTLATSASSLSVLMQRVITNMFFCCW